MDKLFVATTMHLPIRCKSNPYECSGLIRVFWRHTIALHDEQI